MPKVSVLSPTYQHAAYIGDCIRSVLGQTEQDWEMVVIDDGSDDGTADIAESFNDPRIVVLRRRHEGVPGLGRAYAAGLSKATSPFIAVLEGDDTWPSNKVELQLPLLENPDAVLSYGSAGLIDENGCLYARYSFKPRDSVARNQPIGSILPALVRRDFIVACTMMIRRSALDQIGGFLHPPGIPYVDHPTLLRLATTGSFVPSPCILGYWRRHAQQITTRNWFDAPSNRESYLRAAATEARSVVNPLVFASLEQAIRRDSFQQSEESLIFRGRVDLLAGRWGSAASLFSKVLLAGNRLNRLAAGVGILCAGGRTDMERFIDLAGGHSLPSRRHLAAHSSAKRSFDLAAHLKR
jgi:glycosyltransferase involved in cell wall biosynthesis